MYDFSKVKDQAIAERVKKEAARFMKICHWGIQGPTSTEADVAEAIRKLRETGFESMTFDVEMVHVPYVKKVLDDEVDIHVAVSYPMGRMLPEQKIYDIERLYELGVRDVCVCLDWQAIFSGRYEDIYNEAHSLVSRFQNKFKRFAPVIPATLMSDTAIYRTVRALDEAEVVSIKVNPGAGLKVSYEEVQLIQRLFPGRFDVHPAGGIRTLNEAERFLEIGCRVIHSITALDIIDEFIERQLKKYGGI